MLTLMMILFRYPHLLICQKKDILRLYSYIPALLCYKTAAVDNIQWGVSPFDTLLVAQLNCFCKLFFYFLQFLHLTLYY